MGIEREITKGFEAYVYLLRAFLCVENLSRERSMQIGLL